MKRRGILYLLMSFFVVSLFSSLSYSSNVTATSDSIWSGDIILESDTLWADGDFGYRQCEQGEMGLRMYSSNGLFGDRAFGRFVSANESTPEIRQECITQNRHGLFGGNLWSPDGNPANALEVKNASFLPAPASNVVVISAAYGSDPFGSVRSSINYSFPAIGKLTAGTRGRGFFSKVYKQWTITSQAEQLRYADGSPMIIYKWAFSANGRFAAVGLTSGKIARINLQTQEIQPVAQLSSAARQWQLAISNDGDYVLSQEKNTSGVTLHDLAGCTTQHSKDSLPAGAHDTSGCVARDIQSTIVSLRPEASTLGPISGLGFANNSAQFIVGVSWRDSSSGEFQRRKLSFKPENYTSRAQGYLALGDSFSSGEGDTEGSVWYEPGTDEQGDRDTFAGRNLCHLSRRSYPYLMAIELGYLANNTTSPPENGLFHSVACSGAKIHNIEGDEKGIKFSSGNSESFKDRENQYRNDYLADLGRWQPGRVKQLDIFDSDVFGGYSISEQKSEVITIGIGGNDAGFGDTIAACVSFGTCSQADPGSTESINLVLIIAELKPSLTKTYQQIKQQNPEARVYAHGYPIFVQGYGGNCANNVRLDSRETALVEEGIRYINAVVESAAREAGVFYVDVADILQGKNLCSSAENSDIAVNGVTAGNDSNVLPSDILSLGLCRLRSGCVGKESFHPNSIAHRLYATTIINQTNSLQDPTPEPQPTGYPLPRQGYFGQLAVDKIRALNRSEYTTTIPKAKPFLVQESNNISILQSGLLPGSALRVVLYSDPVSLGEYVVDSNGVISQQITLPQDITPGAHQIHITGVNIFGEPIDYFESIIIGQSSDDFDGDGILNQVDSCPIIPNSFTDIDNDGIDDACDLSLAQAQADGGVADNTVDDKGQPSPGTMAGLNEPTSGVLGASITSANSTAGGAQVLGSNTLSSTGDKTAIISLGIGLLIFQIAYYASRKHSQE